MAIRLRQPAFTVATTTTTILVAILLVDSYILINTYIPASPGHDVGDLASARMAAVDDNNLYVTWNDYLTGKHDILLAKSTDGGNTFSAPVNLTSRNGLSSLYSPIFPSKNGIYAVWDTQNGSIYSDVYFANSTDNGNTQVELMVMHINCSMRLNLVFTNESIFHTTWEVGPHMTASRYNY
jgi:hypothetical protein